jgi:hypothetical protein
MAQTINTDQRFDNVTPNFTTLAGAPAQVQAGSVVWASSDETQLLVTPSADGLTAVVDTVAMSPNDADGNPVTARISCSGDADLGNGVVTVTLVSEDVTVTQGPSSMASGGTITFGAPVAKV